MFGNTKEKGMNYLIRITKSEKEFLEQEGLIRYKKKGQEPNIYICNKEHMSRSKTYYVTEEKRILQKLRQLRNNNKV